MTNDKIMELAKPFMSYGDSKVPCIRTQADIVGFANVVIAENANSAEQLNSAIDRMRKRFGIKEQEK